MRSPYEPQLNPLRPFDEYTHRIAKLASVAECLALDLLEGKTDSVEYWHKRLQEETIVLVQLREWVTRDL